MLFSKKNREKRLIIEILSSNQRDRFLIPGDNCLLLRILVDSESCGTDSLLRDAHNMSDIFVIFPYFVKDEEEGIMNSLANQRDRF